MIEKIEFNDLKKCELFSFLQEVEYFKKNKSIEFKPGLNIIFSPNGSGKSSILKMIAYSLAAEQGGVSTVTSSWRMSLKKLQSEETKLAGINVFHDGMPILYGNPRNSVGLIGGTFDDDFMMEGIQNTLYKNSTGYTTLNNLKSISNVLLGHDKMPEDIKYKIQKENLDDSLQELLKAKIKKRQRTILLDEPESGLAMHVQGNFFDILDKAAKEKELQIIVATHSPFCFTTEANFIELIPEHIDISKDALKILMYHL